MPIRSRNAKPAGKRAVRMIWLATLLAMCPVCAGSRSDRVNLFPTLRAGQIIRYEISYQSEKQTKTQSSVFLAEPPPDANVEAHALLRLEILGVQAQGARAIIHGRAWLAALDSGTTAKIASGAPPADSAPQPSPEESLVEFTIFPDGRIDQIKGLDAPLPEQQEAWQEWAPHFAAAAAFPESGVKVAQKWKTDESEKSASPINGLRWAREFTYVRNEPCRAAQMNAQGEVEESAPKQPTETCAVILTTAALTQHSSPKDTTPEDFKLHALRTTGQARGTNKTITYISLKTHLVVRATEEADQSMQVTIAKADGSNRVHYDVAARSRSEIVLVADTPRSPP